MRKLTFFIALFFIGKTFGQSQPRQYMVLHGNQLHTSMYNGGFLWGNGSTMPSFQNHFNGDQVKAFDWITNLWLSGIDGSGKIRYSAERFPTTTKLDYMSGIFDHQTFKKIDSSEFHFNKIWSVRRWQIEEHLADFQNNGQIDSPIDAIIGWPGVGNPHFKAVNGFALPPNPVGWAAFHDANLDGVYNAFDGDFPLPEGVSPTVLPEQVMWFVTSDFGQTSAGAFNMPAEIQVSAWAFHCEDNPALEESVFTSHKISLLDPDPLDSVFVGFWQRAELECGPKGYFGCDPLKSDQFFYLPTDLNAVDTMGPATCFNHRKPAIGLSILNQKLHSSWTTSHPTVVEPGPNGYFSWSAMNSDAGYAGNNFYTGQCDLDGVDNKKFMFPGDPRDPLSCAMINLPNIGKNKTENISSIKIGHWEPNQAIKIDLAWVFAHDSTTNDSLASFSLLTDRMAEIHDFYGNKFVNICQPPILCASDCVWPGDANLDGIANHCDLTDMALAAANGSNTGLPRSPREVWWSPWAAPDFSENTPKTNRNKKHNDADGNGKIELQDLKILTENYNETNPNWQPKPDVFPNGPELSIASAITSQPLNGALPGQTKYAKVMLDAPPGLFALAFEIDCDPKYVREIYGGSFNGFHWQMSHHFMDGPRAGTFSLASSKDSVGEVYVDGQLSLLQVRMAHTFPGTGNSLDTLRLRFKNIKGYLADGTLLDLGGQDFVFTVAGSPVAVNGPGPAKNAIKFHPNPIGEATFLTFENLPADERNQLVLTDISGKKLRELPFSGEKVFFKRDGLPSGLYFFEIKNGSGAGVFAGKLVVE